MSNELRYASPVKRLSKIYLLCKQKSSWITEGKNQALVGATPFCGEYPGPRFEDKFLSTNQMDGISKADEIKWLTVNL